MGAPAPRAILLLCAAASLGQAYFQIAKELLPLAQTPLHPLVLGEPGPACAVSPLTPLGSGLAQNTSDDFLVYHSPGFAGGRGISIVTTPARIQRFAKVRAPSYANDFSSPPYEERPMPGKGRGLVATKTLHRGDRIFADTPILLLDAEAFGGGDDDDDDDYDDNQDDKEVEGVEVGEEQEEDDIHSELAALAVSKLPPAMQRQFWNLHAQAGDDAVMDRIDPNAFELHIGGDTFFGVLPEMARLNHDCRPNAVYSFDAATLTQRVHALADIAPGEEISITYISPAQSRAERLEALRASWGFECSCSACSLPPELTALSDRRVAETERLLERLRGEHGDGEDEQKQKPQVAEALVSLFRQERLWADAHEGWVLAARAYCAAGNYWDTLRHAHLAAEASALWGGAGSPDAVEMARLAEAPEGEACWMKAVKS